MTLALAALDFGRPAGGYTMLSSVQTTVLDPQTAERIEFERRLTASAALNRVQGLGVDAEFRPTAQHRISVRTGGAWLSNAAGMRASAPAGEASHGLSTKPSQFTLNWRDAPPKARAADRQTSI